MSVSNMKTVLIIVSILAFVNSVLALPINDERMLIEDVDKLPVHGISFRNKESVNNEAQFKSVIVDVPKDFYEIIHSVINPVHQDKFRMKVDMVEKNDNIKKIINLELLGADGTTPLIRLNNYDTLLNNPEIKRMLLLVVSESLEKENISAKNLDIELSKNNAPKKEQTETHEKILVKRDTLMNKAPENIEVKEMNAHKEESAVQSGDVKMNKKEKAENKRVDEKNNDANENDHDIDDKKNDKDVPDNKNKSENVPDNNQESEASNVHDKNQESNNEDTQNNEDENNKENIPDSKNNDENVPDSKNSDDNVPDNIKNDEDVLDDKNEDEVSNVHFIKKETKDENSQNHKNENVSKIVTSNKKNDENVLDNKNEDEKSDVQDKNKNEEDIKKDVNDENNKNIDEVAHDKNSEANNKDAPEATIVELNKEPIPQLNITLLKQINDNIGTMLVDTKLLFDARAETPKENNDEEELEDAVEKIVLEPTRK